MAGVLTLIAEAAYRVVEVDPLEFRIRRVTSSDLAVNGHAQLLAMLTPDDLQAVPGMDEEQAHSLLIERFKGLSDVQRHTMARSNDALVCAGVVSVRQSGSEVWDPVDIGTHASDPGAGKLNVQDLPGPMRQELGAAILAHSTDLGGLADSLASFPARPAVAG